MPKFVIEREMVGVGQLPADALTALATKARDVVGAADGDVEWLYSFVTDNKTYCVYVAPDEEVLRERSAQAGFVTTRVSQVSTVLGPGSGQPTS